MDRGVLRAVVTFIEEAVGDGGGRFEGLED
jgi:hypothetical protein